MEKNSYDFAIRYLKQTAIRLNLLKILGPIFGAALIALGQWQALGATGTSLAFWQFAFWTGIVLTVLGALLLAFLDDTAPEILRENFELHRDREEREAFIDFQESYTDSLLARISLTSVLRELIEIAVLEDKWDDDSVGKYCNTVLEYIAQRKHALFGMDDEYWNFSIYKFNTLNSNLECFACKRSSQDDTSSTHRTWSIGEGHIGLAFARRNELVFSDATKDSLKAVIAAKGENQRDYDAERYVSLASLPIASDDQLPPLGILIATSDQVARFTTDDERDDNDWERVDVLREVAAFLAILMHTAHTRASEGQPDEQQNEFETVDQNLASRGDHPTD